MKKKLGKTKEFEKKLQKLFQLNQQNPKKVNDNLIKILADPELILIAYGNLQTNRGSLTKGVDPNDTVYGFNRDFISRISSEILNGSYKWKDIEQVEIPKPGKKKERPLGIVTFSDKLVQEGIRIILTVIYEPVFQTLNMNHGFRPKKSTHTAIYKLSTGSQSMEYALEGNIKNAYDSINHKKLMKILRKKISDKKLLKLIENGLKHNIRFKEKTVLNILGVPRGAIASPILFNIYMHEFDKEMKRILKELETRNKQEKRKPQAKMTKAQAVTKRIIYRKRKRLSEIVETEPFNKELFKELREQIRKDKKLQLTLPSRNKAKLQNRITYCRYADDWVITTNLTLERVLKLKVRIACWLKNELNLELDQEKTCITKLEKKKAKFLGFTFFRHKKNISKVKGEEGETFKRIANELIFIGIDHERIKKRMIGLQIINEKYEPRHVGLYCSLKPCEIVTKFRQKLEGLINYYYPFLTYPSDLGYYYYALRYSCLKTLAHRIKISISQIQKKYGNKIKVPGIRKISDKKKNIQVDQEFIVEFPKYLEIMDRIGEKIVRERHEKKEEMTIKAILRVEKDHTDAFWL